MSDDDKKITERWKIFSEHGIDTNTVLLIDVMVRELKRKHKMAKKLHQTVSGTVECPVCQGVIDYQIDGYRWHSAGKCRLCDLNWRE